MFGLGNIYYVFRMGGMIKNYYENNKDNPVFQKFADFCKDMTANCVANYANTLEQGTWDNMVDKYDEQVAQMTDEEREASANLANDFLNVIDSSENVDMQNMEASIRENPEQWGQYLEQAGVTPERVAEMQAQVDAGEDISNRDIYDVAVSGAATSVDEMIEGKSNEAEATAEAAMSGAIADNNTERNLANSVGMENINESEQTANLVPITNPDGTVNTVVDMEVPAIYEEGEAHETESHLVVEDPLDSHASKVAQVEQSGLADIGNTGTTTAEMSAMFE